jgi:tRNA G18 (ribose-2'-O)-methylase SpoU
MKKQAVLILHDIRSTHNVGSIFRTSDAAGISKIYFTGYTPTPIDDFGVARQDIAKVALGAEKNIPWEYQKSPAALINKLKKEGFQIIAVEQDEKSIDYKKVKPKFPVAFILGNEVGGIPKNLLSKSDVIAEIPMAGKKESLNVSVSVGIILFRVLGL